MLSLYYIVPLHRQNHSRPMSSFERRLQQSFYGRRLSSSGHNYFNVFNPESN